ncbi:MAG: DUF1553 domain-containing protein [Pirellulales bacterium]
MPGLAAAEQTIDSDKVAQVEFFEAKIRPLLAHHCYNCHSADTNSHGGLRVDDRNGLMTGGGRGPAVEPGDPEKSLLIQVIRQTHAQVKMPAEHQLSDEQIADVAQWIVEGATWPTERVPVSLQETPAEYAELRDRHWAWQPLCKPPTPAVNDTAWPRSEIDQFVLARLEAEGLSLVRDADPLTLIRRVTFDLAGRPPTPEEVAEFLTASETDNPDASSLALEAWVDRLLASPAFGERWGRHWLDVARYGESTGSSRNVPYPHAWRYRDYVIDAFNADKPYDKFLCEQIAGDLLPAVSQQQRDEQLIATGFLALGVCDVNQRFKVRFVMDNIDEQIDTVTRAVLGLTVSCARCHDHKFDPIPTTDYYGLAGIFQSSDRCAAVRNKMGGGGMDYYDTSMLVRLGPEIPDPTLATRIEQAQSALTSAQKELQELQANPGEPPSEPERKEQLDAARKQVAAMQQELFALRDPATHGPVALGVRDSTSVGDAEIRIRGEAERLGPAVPRGFLSAVQVADSPAINPRQSGRLELAQWLTSRHNPLTPRVMANRIWQHLFGQGLVRTVDNFGVTGDTPSHPELLDYLAARFIDEGWSVKRMVRAIVLSRSYQLSSDAFPANRAVDPANRFVWQHRPRRLDAEEIRDSMLASCGQLDYGRPAGSPVQHLKVRELSNVSAEASQIEAQSLASRHRSVYLPMLRGLTPQALAVFDFAEQGMVTGARDTTTVAPQALYLLNDSFVVDQSRALAWRLVGDDEMDDGGRVDQAYQLALSRQPTKHEMFRALVFLADYEAASSPQQSSETNGKVAAWTSFCQAIFASAEFRYLR